MEQNNLISRIEDLSNKCSKNATITCSHFLTPAEQADLKKRTLISPSDGSTLFVGGTEDYERAVLFFLPYYMDESDFDWNEYISIIKSNCKFGTPGHRDYLGALIGLGIRREFIGDIWILDHDAYLFCLPSVKDMILREFRDVGRNSIKTQEIAPSDLPELVRTFKPIRFTVSSPRLDAVVSGAFRISRSEASRMILSGKVNLNYNECIKTDAHIQEGDVISLKGHGKSLVESFDGTSHRGRLFINVKVYH